MIRAFSNTLQTNQSGRHALAHGNLILDRYRPLGEAGAGGYGTVTVAWDPRIQRKVAIKSILLTESDALRAALPGANAVAVQRRAAYVERDVHSNPLEDETVPALANIPGLDEARTAAMLSDPHIVTVYDVEVCGRTAYLIMEYIEGITLTKLMREYANYITLDIVAAVVDAVSSALIKAHSNHVLHLDIKPDNILVNREGTVKVTDFGLATLVDASGAGTTGGGTIGYMPLEQMRREELDARTDEWSLASVTYELLTGANPFMAPDLDHAEDAILDAELVLPSLCWDNLDDGMDDVLFYALDPDKEERYQSVRDFQEEADRFLGNAKRGTKELKRIVADAMGAALESLAESEDYFDDGAGLYGDGAAQGNMLDGSGQPYYQVDKGGSDNDALAEREARELRKQIKQEKKLERREEREQRKLEAQQRRQQRRQQRESRIPMSARMTPQVQMVLSRIFGALTSGFIGWLAAVNMPFFIGWERGLFGGDPSQTIPVAVIVLVMVALGAAVPHVGALVAFCGLSLAFIMGSSPIVGVIALALSAIWWYFVARKGIAEPNVAMALPVVGAVGFNAFLPLAAGACLRPLNAFATTLFAAFWAIVLGACGSGNLVGWDAVSYWYFANVDVQERVLNMIVSPLVWCPVASWLLGVVIQSACSTRHSKALDVVGVLLAGALLVVGSMAGVWLESNMLMFVPEQKILLPIIVSTIIMLVVVVWLRPHKGR